MWGSRGTLKAGNIMGGRRAHLDAVGGIRLQLPVGELTGSSAFLVISGWFGQWLDFMGLVPRKGPPRTPACRRRHSSGSGPRWSSTDTSLPFQDGFLPVQIRQGHQQRVARILQQTLGGLTPATLATPGRQNNGEELQRAIPGTQFGPPDVGPRALLLRPSISVMDRERTQRVDKDVRRSGDTSPSIRKLPSGPHRGGRREGLQLKM